MTRKAGRFGRAAVLAGALLGASHSAMAQRSKWIGDYYGFGPEGTIGRGTDILPDGPSMDDKWSYHHFIQAPGTRFYRSGYSGDTAPRTTGPVAAPYRTNRTYEPGDGYRYPLYFNPATGTYFYYPVRP
jgi:hypothetical protein